MEVERDNIKRLRNDKGWTQQQLAEIAGLSLRTIQRVEKLGMASNETVNALCASFEIDRADILSGENVATLETRQPTLTLRQKLAYTLIFLFGAFMGSVLTSMLI